ncbi:MAG: hypothetical protein COV29_02085 [Candidatus Yanofskybacteria bacterium CG10_big_fil_rev_8_21_14_0_10_36_16]|uniref:Glycosyl transferase family 9 n=1 Tax=Candidatus Yanofskybacteria bacterium CG10_big_fil_rev_8_21_14_0_10_36_16 TaxID=1975096 RepID=A0A2J0Q7I6_9BACT|nr:MAG: hypothetical protein COV29_02085 [Candidatus Yanofskybacteria bacterium CG10_big_fil_rev_8_21_14_0_10_36_16]
MFSKIKNLFLLIFAYFYSFFGGKSNQIISNPDKILILRTKPHIGDVVYITPMFGAIKHKYPNSKLYLVGAGRVEEVIRNNPDIDEYLQYDGNFWTVIKRLKKEHIDFACLANAGSAEGLALLYFSGIKSISAFTTINDKPIKSISYSLLSNNVIGKSFYNGQYVPPQYLKLLEPINANNGNVHFRLYFSEEADKNVNEILNKNNIDIKKDFVVGIASGGAVPERWWPSERFAKLAEYLKRKHNAKIILLGAGRDEGPISEILKYLSSDIKVINLLNQSLDEFKATISKLHLVIGNDSGPMVTADAFDVPNIVLVGPTDPREYHRTPGPLNRVVASENKDINSISIEDVTKEVESIMSNR